MKEKYGYFKKNKKTRGIVVTVFACLLCLSAITFGVTSLTKKDKKKDTEDVVDLNNVKKNTDDKSKDNNSNTDSDEADSKTDEKDNKDDENAKNEKIDDENTENASEKNRLDNSKNSSGGKSEGSNDLKNDEADNTQVNNAVESNDAEAGQEYIYDNPDDIFGTVEAGDRIEDNENVTDVAAMVAEYSFGKSNSIKWPVQGNVILDYSMDSTIYFPTLNSYKCNPAIVIQSESGTSVAAGVSGVVQEVSTNEEIGNYVVVGVGDGYEITYGQLKDITVETGDRVLPDTSLGQVGEPTSYYKNEGDNVYFEVKKDGKPCDPLDFLE